jgi:hypothetical protein
MTSRLERYEDNYRALVDELSGIGFISQGSLVVRETSCGKAGCRFQGDPPGATDRTSSGAEPRKARR